MPAGVNSYGILKIKQITVISACLLRVEHLWSNRKNLRRNDLSSCSWFSSCSSWYDDSDRGWVSDVIDGLPVCLIYPYPVVSVDGVWGNDNHPSPGVTPLWSPAPRASAEMSNADLTWWAVLIVTPVRGVTLLVYQWADLVTSANTNA